MASNSVDLHLNIQNSLEKTMKKTKEQTSGFNDKMGEAEKTAGKMREKMSGVGDAVQNMKGQVSRLGSSLQRIMPAFGMIFGGGLIADTVKEAFDLNQAMKDTAAQMGLGVENARRLEGAVYGVMQRTGKANEEAQKFVKSLAELRVPMENLENMAVAAADFSEMTGVSADATSRFTGEMMRMGRVSAESTRDVMKNMAVVQRASGMSAAEMQQLTESMQETTTLLTQMGKSGEEITEFNKGVSRLSGAFASAGVEAKKATEFINEMLDPSKVEENAYLYSQLGISMQEAFSGDVAPEKLIPKFQQLGQRMKNMTGPAAAAMAEKIGMSARTLRQFAEIDTSQQREMMRMIKEEGLSAQEAMRKMNEQQDGANRNFSEAINNLKGQLQPIITDTLIPLVNFLSKKVEDINFTKMFEGLKGIVKGVVNSLMQIDFSAMMDKVKGIMNFLKPAAIAALGVAIFAVIRKIRTKFFSMATGVKEEMGKAFGSTISGAAEKSSERVKTQFNKTAENIGENVKKSFTGSMVDKTKQTYKNLEGQLETTKALKKESKLRYNTSISQFQAERKQLEKRNNYLSKVNKTTLEVAEQERIQKRMSQVDDEMLKYRTRRNKEASAYRRLQNKQLKNLSEDQLRARKRNIEAQRQSADEQLKALNQQEQQLQMQNKNLQTRQEELEAKSRSGNLTTEELKELQEVGSWLDKNEKEMEQITESRQQQNKLIRNAQTEERKLNIVYKKRYRARAKQRGLDTEEGAQAMQGFRGVFAKGMDRLASVGRNVRAMGQNAMFQAGKKWRETGYFLKDKVFSKRAMKQNIGNAVKGGTKSMGKGMKGLGKIMGKLSIPMMLLGVVMKGLQPVIEKLKPVFDILENVLGRLVDILIKALLPPLLKIFSALMPILAALINTALPPLLRVLGQAVKIIGKLVSWLAGELPAQIAILAMKIKAAFTVGKSYEDIRAENEKKLEAIRNNTLAKVGEEIANAGENIAASGRSLSDNKVFTEKQVGKMQDSLNKTAEEIKKGKIGGEKDKGAEGGTGAGTQTKKTTKWTAATLAAGKQGISVEEKASRTKIEQREEKQAEAQEKTAENTKKMADTLDRMVQQNEEATKGQKAEAARWKAKSRAAKAGGEKTTEIPDTAGAY